MVQLLRHLGAVRPVGRDQLVHRRWVWRPTRCSKSSRTSWWSGNTRLNGSTSSTSGSRSPGRTRPARPQEMGVETDKVLEELKDIMVERQYPTQWFNFFDIWEPFAR